MVGGGGGYYTVTAISGSTGMTIQNNGQVGNATLGGLNASPGATINSGAAITPIIENSPTTNTASFVQPSVSSNVQITVGSITGFYNGCQIYINTGGYYNVSSIDGPTLMSITNIGITGNASPTSVINSGNTVTAIQDMLVTTTDLATVCRGLFSNALYFPGEAANAYSTYNVGSARFFGNQITIELWFNPPFIKASTFSELFGRQASVSSWTGNSFRDVGLVMENTSDGKWGFAMDGSSSGPNTSWFVGATGRVPCANWNYLCVTVDFSIQTNNINFYLNGQLINTVTSSNLAQGTAWNRFVWGTNGSWYISNARTAIATWTADITTGIMCECRVYQGIRSAASILAIWNSSLNY